MSLSPVPVSVLRTCLVQAVRSAETLALRLLQRIEHALQQPDPAIQDAGRLGLLADAHRSLRLHQGELLKGYPQALLETLAQSARQPFSFSSPAIADDFGLPDSGGCPQDAARQQSWLDGQRLQQAVAPMVELALADLDALVSAAQGMAYVHPESNPLRPENYVQAWVQLIAAAKVEPAHAHCWLEAMAQHLGPLLVSEYARTAKLLRELGVVPALYAAPPAQAPSVARRRQGDPAGSRARWQAPEQYGNAVAQSRAYAAQRESLLTLCLLQELLSDPRWIEDSCYTAPQALTDSMLGHLAEAEAAQPSTVHSLLGGFNQATAFGTAAAMPAAAGEPGPGWSSSYSTAALASGLHRQGAAGLPSRPPAAAAGLSRSARTLQRMMEHMAQDAQLLPSVQQVLRLLEPALLQLVEQDARFFEDRLHPARQLLDELTARSLWFADEAAPGFARFIQAADSAARQLAAWPAVDAQAFAQVLQHLRDGWSPPGAGHGVAADEEPGQPQGQSRSLPREFSLPDGVQPDAVPPDSSHIAHAIRRLPSARGVPEDMLDFVTGPWAQVIAHAQRLEAGGQALPDSDPGGYLALVPSLLWSVSPQASADTRRLAALAPRLQARLAAGLRSVGRTEWEIRALAARLAALHQDALDAGMARQAPAPGQPDALDLLPSMLAALDGAHETQHAPLAQSRVQESPAPEAALAVAEAQEVLAAALGNGGARTRQPRPSGQRSAESWMHSAPQAKAAVQAGPDQKIAGADGGPAASGPAADAGDWPLGTWVELRNERQQLRTRLTWMSPQQSLFLFTAADGSTQSMTRRMRDKLVAKGQLRRIEGESLE